MPDWSFQDTFTSLDGMRVVLQRMLSTIQSELPVEEETFYDLKVIMYELCGNALEHGKLPAEVYASVCRKDSCLHVLVSDSGKGFCPGECFLSGIESEHGRGLHIVHTLADDIVFNSAANKVLVRLHI